MRVSRIALSGFRNYEWESFTFDPGTNVIRGKNGQGKTNLLEAVFMLTGGKSFRTRFDREIVGFGFSSAEILADVEAAGREQTVKITLAPGQRKQILVNSVKKSASAYTPVRAFRTGVFCCSKNFLKKFQKIFGVFQKRRIAPRKGGRCV